MSTRHQFTTMLAALPLHAPADAIVLLTGDGETRIPTAIELYKRGGAAKILVSGGVDAPPYAVPAAHLKRTLVEHGVYPDAILVEDASTHTRESADACCAIAKLHGWGRVLLVTSAYHMPRAFLSFVAALAQQERALQVVPVACTQPWFDAADRLGLIDVEAAKIVEYQRRGDVANYAEGIAYLKASER